MLTAELVAIVEICIYAAANQGVHPRVDPGTQSDGRTSDVLQYSSKLLLAGINWMLQSSLEEKVFNWLQHKEMISVWDGSSATYSDPSFMLQAWTQMSCKYVIVVPEQRQNYLCVFLSIYVFIHLSGLGGPFVYV